jgi:hypothetical protein
MFRDSTVVPAMAARIEQNGYSAGSGICASIRFGIAR